MTEHEAASFMYDIINLDFFQDLGGALKDLITAVSSRGGVGETLESLLSEHHQRDQDGELVD
eukprot:CAMPEP_0175025388 /NCGR_PEP_ID=MMETSP0005-20121125/17082_1 /TAXON_ID=420556 /ORGANISM="Ochromonas sp., Strain CCMP1393" /LENGTH=61 /DNA_ID=CAMNT_0016284221 /DNA_START=462 /DNA_END=644 /DNA_ORIENTATION=+